MSDPTTWTATEQAQAIAARRLGSEELLEAFLARIAAVDPAVNAVCTLAVDAARARCREADSAIARGESWGPLHGLPVTIKDAIATVGIRSTGGAEVLRDHVPTDDAPAVAALKTAGAIVFGKTNLPEWSGDWQTFNTLFGTTNNPWDLERTPGGSSGGAAAAVACGMTAFELGTDIGGSVRVPASFCGVYGLKPSWGVIPTFGYLDEPNGGLTESDVNVFGPIARSSEDLALLLDVLAGSDRPVPRPATLQSPEGLRVVAWFDDPTMSIDDESRRLLEAAVDALAALGATVDRATRPAFDAEEAWRTGLRLIGAAVSVSDGVDRGLTHREWLYLDRRRARYRAAWAEFFASFDVLMCPVTLVPAFEHLQGGYWADRTIMVNGVARKYLDLEAWLALTGAAYLPSVSTPVGRTVAGLPVGVQVVAPYLHDHIAIRVAGWLGNAAGGYEVPPLAKLESTNTKDKMGS